MLQNAFAVVLMTPLGLAAWVAPSPAMLAWLAVAGFLGTVGPAALTWAYRRAEASRLGALDYTAFVWATGLGFVVFGEVPSAATLAGAALIIVGALVAMRAPGP